MQGTPWPRSTRKAAPPAELAADEIESYSRQYETWCENPSGEREGLSTAWYGNGRMRRQGRREAGELVSLTQWDEHGRVTKVVRCEGEDACTQTRRWWHHNGVLAVQGEVRDGVKHGTWQQWDAAGSVVGEVRFETGVPIERTTDSEFLIRAPLTSVDGGPDLPAELPRSDSWIGLGEGIVVSMDDAALRVDGEPLFALVQSRLPEAELKGSAIVRLLQRLSERAAAHARQVPGPDESASPALLWALPPTLTGDDLLKLLYTAGQAGLGDNMHFVVVNPAAQWPPHEGPERLQGAQVPMRVPLTPSGRLRSQDIPKEAWVTGGDDLNEQAFTQALASSEAVGVSIGLNKRLSLQDIITVIDLARRDNPQRGVVFVPG